VTGQSRRQEAADAQRGREKAVVERTEEQSAAAEVHYSCGRPAAEAWCSIRHLDHVVGIGLDAEAPFVGGTGARLGARP
jgi:hypothetical protein